jgi:hypothetical protein
VQLIEKEPGIYDKHHPDYARRDKIDLAWERISHEMESGMCVYVYISKHRICLLKQCEQLQYNHGNPTYIGPRYRQITENDGLLEKVGKT